MAFIDSKEDARGMSLIEVVLAIAILSGMIISVGSILQSLGHAQQQRDLRQIARQLAQDQIETLKSRAFPNVFLTAEEDSPGEGCLQGAAAFDRHPDQFPPEEVRWGATRFTRQTCVEMVRPAPEDGQLARSPANVSTGLKRVIIRVRWPAAHPVYEEEQESVLQDPAGPLVLADKTGTVHSSVGCLDGEHESPACGQVSFYVFGPTGVLNDTATSDRDGTLVFSRIPLGRSIIKPQLEAGESMEPSEYALATSLAGMDWQGPSFILTRSNAAVTLTSNRENTLVVAMPGTPEAQPPDVTLSAAADAGLYSQRILDKAVLRLSPGSYSLRCWWTDAMGRARFMDPPGGTNALLTAGDTFAYACHFDD